MKKVLVCCALLVFTLPLQADRCVINYAAHGTFREVGDCLQFVSDFFEEEFEVTNPRGSWKDGMTGTVFAEFLAEGNCSTDIGDPIRVCSFDADYTRNVVGTLEILQFVSCPGYVIRTETITYKLLNCDDFGDELCHPDNVGRRVQAQVFVDTSISNCIDSLTTVIDFRFLQ